MNTHIKLALAGLALSAIVTLTGCANPTAMGWTHTRVKGLKMDMPSGVAGASTSIVSLYFGVIDVQTGHVNTNVTAATLGFQSGTHAENSIFGKADNDERDTMSFGPTAVTTEVGGRLLQRTGTNGQFNAVLSLTP